MDKFQGEQLANNLENIRASNASIRREKNLARTVTAFSFIVFLLGFHAPNVEDIYLKSVILLAYMIFVYETVKATELSEHSTYTQMLLPLFMGPIMRKIDIIQTLIKLGWHRNDNFLRQAARERGEDEESVKKIFGEPPVENRVSFMSNYEKETATFMKAWDYQRKYSDEVQLREDREFIDNFIYNMQIAALSYGVIIVILGSLGWKGFL